MSDKNETKRIVASIVQFLKQQMKDETMRAAHESIEVSVQCLESAFELRDERGPDLLQLFRGGALDTERADQLKTEGNELMKSGKFREALERYSQAIVIDPRNAVYFCNRAAAHFKLGAHEAAVADCTAALALQPDYGKAHGRLGLALTALDRHREARSAFARAAQLEPDNDSYKQNLRLADERLAQRGERPPLDLGNLLQNPALLNMATEMLSDPNMQNLISGLMSTGAAGGGAVGGGAGAAVGGTGGGVAAGGMGALLEAGQALAAHMQAANPELVEQLRRQVRPPQPDPAQQPPKN